MITDEQVVKVVNDILDILQPLKDQWEKKDLQSKSEIKHWSDCAVNNEPAMPRGKCDCGGYFGRGLLETMHDECLDLPTESTDAIGIDRRVRLGDVLEVFNKRLSLLCPCGNKIDTNDGQQMRAKMCQSCLDNL